MSLSSWFPRPRVFRSSGIRPDLHGSVSEKRFVHVSSDTLSDCRPSLLPPPSSLLPSFPPSFLPSSLSPVFPPSLLLSFPPRLPPSFSPSLLSLPPPLPPSSPSLSLFLSSFFLYLLPLSFPPSFPLPPPFVYPQPQSSRTSFGSGRQMFSMVKPVQGMETGGKGVYILPEPSSRRDRPDNPLLRPDTL